MFRNLAYRLDRAGMRWIVADLASMRHGQDFSITKRGYWVNSQKRGTIVSPIIHTAPFESYESRIVVEWLFDYVPRIGDTILDLGTGVGEEAVVFSPRIGKEGRMFAVEAHAETFDCLTETIRLSGLDNVTPIHCAIGDRDGEIRLAEGKNNLTHSVVQGRGKKVPMRSIDSLVAEYAIERIDFLRANIEGAEKLMLGGIEKSAALIQNVCISCHDFLADRGEGETFRTRAAVREWMQDQGFHIREPFSKQPPIGDYLYGRRERRGPA